MPSDTQLAELADQTAQNRRKDALAAYIQHHGMPPMVDGPKVEHFNALELAAAIEHEIGRAQITGWTKIELRMDLIDAFRLARHLRGNDG